MFPVYSGKCPWCKAVPPWWQTFRWWQRGWNAVVEVAGTTVIRLLCCRFWCTGKVIGQVHRYWWRICREINALCFISTCDLFTDSPWYLY
jgi:hypothetical protein